MMEELIYEKAVFAPKGGKPGYIVNGKWYPVDSQDLKTPAFKQELERYARTRGSEQLKKDEASLSKPKPEPAKPAQPAPKPEPAKPAQPAPTPARPAPPAPSPTPARPSGTTPAPAPAAPKPSPAAAYMTAAAKARKSGDPAEMAKVRDMGMEIWRKSNPKLAAASDERARIRGTAQTDNPLMKDMKSRLPLTPSVQAPAVKNLGSGQQSLSQNSNVAVAATPKPQVPPVTVSKDATMNKSADELSKNPLGKKKEVKTEAYDIVLDYLISEGHADTISEAHYVMLQMDSEHIQNIVEALRDIWTKPSAAERVQMQSPFAKPNKPLPSTPSPFAKPASTNDSGRLTTYGAGGGAAAEKAGKSRAEIMRQGAKNLENKKRSQPNPGPNFGR